LIHTGEVFVFTAHQIDLFVKLLYFLISGSDLALELFDFVVKYELELFKLLNLLSEVLNDHPLVSESDISVFDFLSIY